jgi:glucose uptake protein GlcU
MVPFKLSDPQEGDINDVFRYLVSFGLSSVVIAPVLFLVYCVFVRQGSIPSFHVRAALVPGVSSGVLWAAANFMSVHATFYLGIKIGFPLTQTCVLIAAFWGVVYFKEFDVRSSGHIYRFAFGILFILIGAYLLGASG